MVHSSKDLDKERSPSQQSAREKELQGLARVRRSRSQSDQIQPQDPKWNYEGAPATKKATTIPQETGLEGGTRSDQ